MLKWTRRIALGVIVLLLVVGGGGYLYLRQALPVIDGSVAVAGIAGPVEIVRDRHAIPHIFAATAAEASFALGFVHAQDRLWQLEMNRRIVRGRLAEVLGPAALDTDRFLRTLGIGRIAEAIYPRLDETTRRVLDAYAAGINAYLAGRHGPLPPEFLVLGVTPEPWTPADSIGWLKMMAWDLGGNWRDELLRLHLSRRLPAAQAAEFFPPYPGDAPVVLSELAALPPFDAAAVERLLAAAPPPLPRGAGSNNWVLSGRRTTTGKPLLANDPHLGLSMPPVWYFAHLETPELQVIGATLPGVPLVVLGRNARIAWGFTNTGPDVQDLFIEQLDPADPNRYRTPDGWRTFDSWSEVIRVKDAPDVTMTVRRSRHGPIISDIAAGARQAVGDGHVLAFAWTGLAEDDLTIQAGLKVAEAGNWDDFRAAMRDYHVPQQNIVYADVDGNIGFIAPARVPVRRSDNELMGMVPAPGWEARYDWTGYIPFDALPQSFNPPSGQVVTANNKVVPDDYPYFITNDWTEPYRVRRIAELLDAREIHSLQSFMEIQGDISSTMVRDMLPLLLQTRPSDPLAAQAIDRLRTWGGVLAGNRPEPLIVAAWLRQLTRLVYADELGEMFGQAWTLRPIFMQNVLTDRGGASRWCDDITTPAVETCAEQLTRSLDIALQELTEQYGRNPEHWRWEEAHFARAKHRPFSGITVLGWLFDATVPTAGGTYTVNAAQYRLADPEEPFANRHAASLRAIYDLADLDRSVFIHSGGQSGNPLSPHYKDFMRPWANLEYLPMTIQRRDIESGALGTLRLTPQR